MKRREFITLLGGAAAAWPVAGWAQKQSMPVIGYLSSFPADINPKFMQAFRQGLNDAGFFEGRNATIEYRWDEEGRYDRLPVMAADLVRMIRHLCLRDRDGRTTYRQGAVRPPRKASSRNERHSSSPQSASGS
jgi:hypothetical protein